MSGTRSYPGGMIGKIPAFNAANIAHVERGNIARYCGRCEGTGWYGDPQVPCDECRTMCRRGCGRPAAIEGECFTCQSRRVIA